MGHRMQIKYFQIRHRFRAMTFLRLCRIVIVDFYKIETNRFNMCQLISLFAGKKERKQIPPFVVFLNRQVPEGILVFNYVLSVRVVH
jgi:hypothetical protein